MNVLKTAGDLAEKLSSNIAQTAEKNFVSGVCLVMLQTKAFSSQGVPVLLSPWGYVTVKTVLNKKATLKCCCYRSQNCLGKERRHFAVIAFVAACW